MTELEAPLPPVEQRERRRSDEGSPRRVANLDRRAERGTNGGSTLEIEPPRRPSIKLEPKKGKPRPLPAALVLTLRVALSLAALAVPAIFLQNSGRRRDPIVSAVVTLECVS